MPLSVLIALLFIFVFMAIFWATGAAVSFACFEKGKKFILTGIFFTILVLAILGWMDAASNQDQNTLGYFQVQSQKYDSGAMTQYIIVGYNWNSSRVDVTKETSFVYPEKTFIRAYRNISYKNGIRWGNEEEIHIDRNGITPENPEYNKIKEKWSPPAEKSTKWLDPNGVVLALL